MYIIKDLVIILHKVDKNKIDKEEERNEIEPWENSHGQGDLGDQ